MVGGEKGDRLLFCKQEPGRLHKRYLIESSIFTILDSCTSYNFTIYML